MQSFCFSPAYGTQSGRQKKWGFVKHAERSRCVLRKGKAPVIKIKILKIKIV